MAEFFCSRIRSDRVPNSFFYQKVMNVVSVRKKNLMAKPEPVRVVKRSFGLLTLGGRTLSKLLNRETVRRQEHDGREVSKIVTTRRELSFRDALESD